MKKSFKHLLVLFIMVQTFSCSSSDEPVTPAKDSKSDCIENELKIRANTLDDVATSCKAIRSEVLAQLSDDFGSCDKNGLSFGKPISDIINECGVSEVPIANPSSSSSFNGASSLSSSSSKDNSSSSENIKWTSDNGGTIEIVNASAKDIVVFHGQVLTQNNIMGGVRAGTTKNFDVSKHVSDFDVGGYMILRGITREQYDANYLELSDAKIEFNAFATYKAGEKYRIAIGYNSMGDNAVRFSNRGRIGLELRKNSPEGEKVAYLPALQINQMLYTQTTDAVTLFPFYVLYNKSNHTITTLKSTSMYEAVFATPRPFSNLAEINTISFPDDETMSWERIVGTLKSPFAYITIVNNVMNLAAYFTNAGSMRYYSQNGYDAIGSGEQLVFEVEAADADEEGDGGGIAKALMVTIYGGTWMIPVLFEGETTQPVIKNGYDYTVSINPNNEGGYTATIREGQKRDISDLLESL